MLKTILPAFALLLFGSALAAPKASAKADLANASGEKIGTATFTETKAGVRISVKAEKLSPGIHGLHVHAVGKCEGPDFKSAGPHFNPGNRQHGHHNPKGAHAGDLPNLRVDKNGNGKASATVMGMTLGEGPKSLLGGEGTALVIHADPDDDRTDPSGNSGARIACGVITKE